MPKMLRFRALTAFGALAATCAASPAAAVLLGPSPALCLNNNSAVLVTVTGFKNRAGRLRVQLYASDANYLRRGTWIERIEVAVPASGPAQICVPARAGRYMISVRHDANDNGRVDLRDGGGFSGNPRVRFTDVIAKRKPSLSETSFTVGATTARVPVMLNYVRGLSFGPAN